MTGRNRVKIPALQSIHKKSLMQLSLSELLRMQPFYPLRRNSSALLSQVQLIEQFLQGHLTILDPANWSGSINVSGDSQQTQRIPTSAAGTAAYGIIISVGRPASGKPGNRLSSWP
jgi:hypothetical protein